jgi:hypothetical protein
MEDNNTKKKITFGALDETEQELKFERATFADGSRVVPRISVQFGRRYIPWRDNGDNLNVDYCQKVIEMYNNSGLHHAIIDMKAEAIAGSGLVLEDESQTGTTKGKKTLAFITQKNQFGMDCNEINKRLAMDYTLFNGFSAEQVFRKDWKAIDQIIHLDIHKVRVQTPDGDGLTYGHYYAFDWTLYRPWRLQYIENWNADTAHMKKAQYDEILTRYINNNVDPNLQILRNFLATGNTQIYVHKNYQPNANWYPLPDYVAILPAVETDILSDQYATASLMNSMDSGLVITILGDSSDPECQKTARRILKSYAGARKAGKPVILFADSFEEAPKLEPINTTSNGMAAKYREINDSVQQKIISGHRIPNAGMLGLQVAGKLGNTSDAPNAEEIFYNKYIKPRQQVIEKFWNEIMDYNDLCHVKIAANNIFNENKIISENAGIPTEEQVNVDAFTPSSPKSAVSKGLKETPK